MEHHLYSQTYQNEEEQNFREFNANFSLLVTADNLITNILTKVNKIDENDDSFAYGTYVKDIIDNLEDVNFHNILIGTFGLKEDQYICIKLKKDIEKVLNKELDLKALTGWSIDDTEIKKA